MEIYQAAYQAWEAGLYGFACEVDICLIEDVDPRVAQHLLEVLYHSGNSGGESPTPESIEKMMDYWEQNQLPDPPPIIDLDLGDWVTIRELVPPPKDRIDIEL
jgi:hypothetical protein